MVKRDDHIDGDERWDIDDLSGKQNDDGTWDVMIRAQVRLPDEVGARAQFLQVGDPDHMVNPAQVVQNVVASYLVRGPEHALTFSDVTFVNVVVGTGLDSFTGATEGF